MLRAPDSVGRRSSKRVDDGRKGQSLLAIKMKARTVVGRREKSLLGDPGSESCLGREKEKKKRAKIVDGISKIYLLYNGYGTGRLL